MQLETKSLIVNSLETSKQVQFRETNRENLTKSIWSEEAGCRLGEVESSLKNLFNSVGEPKQERF